MKNLKSELQQMSPSLEEHPFYVPTRLLRTYLHSDDVIISERPFRSASAEAIGFLRRTLLFFKSLSMRKPELLPTKQLNAGGVLRRLARLGEAGFDHYDHDNQQRLNEVAEMASEILFLLRTKSDEPAGFDADCVHWALELRSDYATRTVVLFLEQVGKPKELLPDEDRMQAELLVEIGSVSHGRMRKFIRGTLKRMGRPDLLSKMDAGGPPIAQADEPPNASEPMGEPLMEG